MHKFKITYSERGILEEDIIESENILGAINKFYFMHNYRFIKSIEAL